MTLSAYLPPLFAATIVVGLLMAFWLLWVLFLAGSVSREWLSIVAVAKKSEL